VALIVGYLKTKDDYTESSFGLTSAEYDTWSGELNWTPNDKTNLYAFYSYEKIVDAQTGRQSGSTVSVNPLDNWTSNVEDKVNSFGAGLDLTLKPEKWFLNVFGRYQKVDGFNDMSAPPGGAPANARNAFGGVQDIADYDDTKLAALNAELRYQLSKAWEFTLGGFFEDYEIRDSQTSELRNYSPGSFFLAANDADYQAKVGYFRVTYRF
jgi:hypothetical protein